ncbi:MAG: hypothetical protein NUV97_00325 [archaeon]|nr:hypothetical protein [archaeon]
MKSKKWDLNKKDYTVQLQSALRWLSPLFILYLVQLLAVIAKKKVLGIADLTPDTMTIGAGQLYLLNQLYGLFTKLKSGK